MHGDMRNAYHTLVRKSEEKRPLRRPRCRWEDNIEMDHRERGCEDGRWMKLTEDFVQWRILDLAALIFRALVSRRYLINQINEIIKRYFDKKYVDKY